MAEIIELTGLKGKCKYSNKLMWELKDFFAKNDSGYYDDRIDEGILAVYHRLGNDICIKILVQVREEDYVCITALGIDLENILPEREQAILQWCNRVNCELDYGSFQLMDGEVVYRTYFNPGLVDCFDGLDMLLGYPMQVIEKYGQSFLDACGLRHKMV